MPTNFKPLANLLIDVDMPSLAVTAPLFTSPSARSPRPVVESRPGPAAATLPRPRSAIRVELNPPSRQHLATQPAISPTPLAPLHPSPAFWATYTSEHRHQLKLLALAELGPGLAHDLNNLMMIISARVMLAHSCAGVTDRVETHLSAIDTSAERARETMRSLLAMVRPESPDRCEFDLACVGRETAAMLRRLLPVGVRVNIEVPESPAPIHGSPDQFRQLLLHLAVRAKFMIGDSGEILIAINHQDCEHDGFVGASAGPSRTVCLSVLHASNRIMEPVLPHHTQAHLNLAGSIIHDHGGTLAACDARNPGEPSRVTMTLPLARPIAQPTPTGQLGGTSRPWLLLVTSSAELRQRVADAIGRTGLPLVTVDSLDSAQMRSGQLNAENRPSGIIVDSNSICRDSLQGLSDDLPCLIADEHGLSRPTAAPAAETTTAATRHTYLGLFAQTPSTANDGQPDAPTFDAVQQWVEELTANRARRCAEAHIPALLD